MDGETGEETTAEMETHLIQVEDARREKDAGQQFALSERLKQDSLDQSLQKAKKFLGKYSPVDINSLSVRIVDGKVGEGTIKGHVIELQMPLQRESIATMKSALGPILSSVPSEELDAKCEEVALAAVASTALHEGHHGLLDSKPGSDFATDFENISKLPNEGGKMSTLLDEGITYAVQDIFAPTVEPIGRLAPTPRETDDPLVKQTKELGQRLKGQVDRYISEGKTIDNDFLQFASTQLQKVTTQV